MDFAVYGAQPALSESQWQRLRGLQVLVSDDNPISQMVLQQLLEGVGCVVTLVDNGEDAIRQFTQQRFQLVIMDAMMPKLDGPRTISVLRELERREQWPAAALLLLTADAVGVAKGRYNTPHIDGYMSKPFSRYELLTEVNRLLELRAASN